jgi:hypothetical protein
VASYDEDLIGMTNDEAFQEWALRNPEATEAELFDFIDWLGVTARQKPKYQKAYLTRLGWARRFASKVGG